MKTIELFANTGIQYVTVGPAEVQNRDWSPVKLSNGSRPKWIKEKRAAARTAAISSKGEL